MRWARKVSLNRNLPDKLPRNAARSDAFPFASINPVEIALTGLVNGRRIL
jgi:hypothetical protein